MDQHFWPPILALAIPLLALCIPIVHLVLRHARLRHKAELMHETVRHLAQLGQPIPPDLLLMQEPQPQPVRELTAAEKSEQVKSLLRKGVLAVSGGVGLGLVVFLVNLDDGRFTGFHGWAWGLLPVLLGLGWLFLWRVESRQLQGEQAAASLHTH